MIASAAVPCIGVYADTELCDLLPWFIQGRRTDAAQMAHALSNEDFETVRVIARRVMGNGVAFGFAFLSRVGWELYRAAERENASDVEALLQELAYYLLELRIDYAPQPTELLGPRASSMAMVRPAPKLDTEVDAMCPTWEYPWRAEAHRKKYMRRLIAGYETTYATGSRGARLARVVPFDSIDKRPQTRGDDR